MTHFLDIPYGERNEFGTLKVFEMVVASVRTWIVLGVQNRGRGKSWHCLDASDRTEKVGCKYDRDDVVEVGLQRCLVLERRCLVCLGR